MRYGTPRNNADTDANGTLDERLWAQQDANWNVTALVNGSGAVVERYVYDPYGSPTVLTGSWGSRSSSLYGWRYLHQGGRYDAAAGLYHFRNRDYSPTLGRWTRNDPIGYDGRDVNLYRAVGNDPLNGTDPKGLRESVETPLRAPYPPPDVTIPEEWRDEWYINGAITPVRPSYPPQAFDRRLNKVALISDLTCYDDWYRWIPDRDHHTYISGERDLRNALHLYKDGSIDVLVISGHTGSMCSARASKENLGGLRMKPEIYRLIRRKLSPRGQILMTSCGAGSNAIAQKEAAKRFGCPVTANDNSCCGTRWGGKYAYGGAAIGWWKTYYPTTVPSEIVGAVGVGSGPLGPLVVPGLPLGGTPVPGPLLPTFPGKSPK